MKGTVCQKRGFHGKLGEDNGEVSWPRGVVCPDCGGIVNPNNTSQLLNGRVPA